MARGPEIQKRDVERARKVLEFERTTTPYRRPNACVSWLMFIVALAIAGVIAYYVFTHRQQLGRLWQRATHPDSLPGQIVPGQ